jgi:hypothetical protein
VAFAVGFQDAGHEVWFLEDSGDEPWCYDPVAQEMDPEARYGVSFLAREMDAIGMGDRWSFRHGPTGRLRGACRRRETADVIARGRPVS